MYSYSSTSAKRLSSCHEDLQILFNEVIKHFDTIIICGHRGQQEQDEAFTSGHSQKRWPDGNHNADPSHAVDASPSPYNVATADGIKQLIYFSGFVIGMAAQLYTDGKITHKIRWGGDWNQNNILADNKFNDLVHFELVP